MINELLDQKIKDEEKKHLLVKALKDNQLHIDEISKHKDSYLDKDVQVIVEALNEVSYAHPEITNSSWLSFLKTYINSSNNHIKRNVLLAIGNLSSLYPNNLDGILKTLLTHYKETNKELQLVKYDTLTKIIRLDKYKDSSYEKQVKEIGEALVANSSGLLNF